MKAAISGRTIFLLPSNPGERELMGKINHLTFDPTVEILTDEQGNTLTYLQNIKFHFQLADDGTEVVDAIIET